MSNKPVLYYTMRSPPCRSVLLCAAAIGVELELREMNLVQGEHLTPEFLQKNPQHTIPTLEDNGIILTDSHVICSHLADKYSKDENLYPKDYLKRLDVQSKLHFNSGHIFARIRFLYEYIIYRGVKGIDPEKVSYIQKTFEVLENYLKKNTYVCGDHLTIADLCFIASVSSVSETAPIDKAAYPKLQAWVEKLQKLPYYEKWNGEGAKTLQILIKEKALS